MLELRGVSKSFYKSGVLGQVLAQTRAVQDVSLTLTPGRTLGVIGESGSGKSTLARIALRMIDPDEGQVLFDGVDMLPLQGKALNHFRHAVQPVFQDSAGALDPRMSIRRILTEPLVLRGDVARAEFDDRIAEGLRAVGLDPELLTRRPGALSGGQRQRIGIARALLMEPRFLILDEPVSALDVSVQAQVLNLLKDLQDEKGLGYLFVGHDLYVAKFFCDEIMVMYQGQVEEHASSAHFFAFPQSTYAHKLLAAIPKEI